MSSCQMRAIYSFNMRTSHLNIMADFVLKLAHLLPLDVKPDHGWILEKRHTEFIKYLSVLVYNIW